MKQFIPALILSLIIAAATPLHVHGAEPAPDAKEVHPVRGVIRRLSSDGRQAVIRHEAIPDYMPAMTMAFNVRDTNELTGVAVGDTITFALTTTGGTHWIDGIRRVAGPANTPSAATTRITSPGRIAELKPGDALPDCELLAEDGQRIRLSAFRGKALALTFFFTRCPLPDYCPRMGSNFAKARELILAKTGTTTNWHFLSISLTRSLTSPRCWRPTPTLTAWAMPTAGSSPPRPQKR